MNAANQNLLNMVLSVVAPVVILNKCSQAGDAFWQIGTQPALVLALSLPIGYGIYNFIKTKKHDPLNILGLAGVLCTGIITIYANTGEGTSIRPDTPWWYAAKEALIPLLMACAIVATAKSKGALLRIFIYTDALFAVERIEKKCRELGKEQPYQAILWRASLQTAGSLLFSASANFALALYFLLPILQAPDAEQALLYNYAIGDITLWGYFVIGVPILGTLAWVLYDLCRSLKGLTGFKTDEVMNNQ